MLGHGGIDLLRCC